MMGHMMPMRGPMMRSRLPIGPRAPFPPRFMHPDMYRAALPPNQRKTRFLTHFTFLIGVCIYVISFELIIIFFSFYFQVLITCSEDTNKKLVFC